MKLWAVYKVSIGLDYMGMSGVLLASKERTKTLPDKSAGEKIRIDA